MKHMKKYLTVTILSFFLFSCLVPTYTTCAITSGLTVDLVERIGSGAWVDNIEARVGTKIEFKAEVTGITDNLIAMAAIPQILDFTSANPAPDDITTNPNGDKLLIWYRDSSNERLTFYFNAIITNNDTKIVQFMALVLPASTAKDNVTVTGRDNGNQKPNKPSTPSGPKSGNLEVSYSYQTSTTDPNGDQLCYMWDWGDGTPQTWTGSFNSGQMATASHAWSTKGNYSIKVKAKDIPGELESDWSDSFIVTIKEISGNTKPNKPSLSGTSNGEHGASYSYTVSATDPDGDQVYYLIDWGDETPSTGWKGPFNSGYVYTVSHIWSAKGGYTITAQSKDSKEALSDVTTLPVTMPYTFNNPILQFFELLFQRFPYAFPILRHMLGY